MCMVLAIMLLPVVLPLLLALAAAVAVGLGILYWTALRKLRRNAEILSGTEFSGREENVPASQAVIDVTARKISENEEENMRQ